MDYFKLFDLEPRFDIDAKALKVKFLKMSKMVHPDFHANASTMDQLKILEQSTALNKAYKTLSNPLLTLEYILKNEGKLEGKPDELPQEFLFEMMDFNERIMELRMEPDPVQIDAIQTEFKAIQEELENELQENKQSYDAHQDEKILDTLRFLYYKKKYLSRIEEHMDKLTELLS